MQPRMRRAVAPPPRHVVAFFEQVDGRRMAAVAAAQNTYLHRFLPVIESVRDYAAACAASLQNAQRRARSRNAIAAPCATLHARLRFEV
ncbi:hypothetical protein OH687_23700 [Burkholderia anthina]|nr:hypothetical protein OH687_23700 [Burkholderia anthina]